MNIKAENIHKSYTTDKGVEVKAIREASLDIAQGEIVAVTGPSGAGKSTLLHILGLMDKPSGGRIFMDGNDITGLTEKQRADMRRMNIGFLFQMHYLLPEFTVFENVMIPVWDKIKEKKEAAVTLLHMLGLEGRLDHLPSELSGGEQQRAALARALINDPGLILADEPTGDLDRETGEKVERILLDECRNRKVTLILVTHNDELAKKATRTIRMRDGIIQPEPSKAATAAHSTERPAQQGPASGSQAVHQKYFV